MGSICTLNEQILRNFVSIQSNSLNHIVQEDDSDNDDSLCFVQSNYYAHDDIVTIAANFIEYFSVLTLNCLNAKFDSLTLLIEELRKQNVQFSEILNLKSYQMFIQNNLSSNLMLLSLASNAVCIKNSGKLLMFSLFCIYMPVQFCKICTKTVYDIIWYHFLRLITYLQSFHAL